MSYDPAFWSRLQFAFMLTYHYLFLQFTMGLASFLVYWKSHAFLVCLLVTGSAAIFPVMLYSTFAPNSLTSYTVASSPCALRFASIWWPMGFMPATVYFVFISRRYAGKASVKRDNQGFY